MAKVTFEIIGEPQGKGRHRVQVVGKGKIHTYTPDKTANYENLVKIMYLKQGNGERLQGAIKATIAAYYAIPQSWTKKKKEQACKGLIYPQKKPDMDNIAKIILDSLNGIAYEDDKQVVELHLYKQFAEQGKVYVTLETIGG